jgi:hypothetical protein
VQNVPSTIGATPLEFGLFTTEMNTWAVVARQTNPPAWCGRGWRRRHDVRDFLRGERAVPGQRHRRRIIHDRLTQLTRGAAERRGGIRKWRGRRLQCERGDVGAGQIRKRNHRAETRGTGHVGHANPVNQNMRPEDRFRRGEARLSGQCHVFVRVRVRNGLRGDVRRHRCHPPRRRADKLTGL